MAKSTGNKNTGTSETVVSGFDPYSRIDDILNDIEREYDLSHTLLDSDESRTSTGLLGLDFVLGGGIVGGGWYTFLGMEQSGKSTLASTIMINIGGTKIPIVSFWDYEGSTQADYVTNILETIGSSVNVEDLLGVMAPDGRVIKPGRVRYYNENVLEKFFDYSSKLLRYLPNKVRMGDQWYYVYEDTKANQKLVGDGYDKAFYKRTGKFRFPADNSDIQALFMLDSYPSMNPAANDEDDPSNALAVQARAFSENIKRIRGRLRGKRATVLGVNQLRVKPGPSFGDPSYEPCGSALKHACVAGETLIITGNGIRTIRDLYDNLCEDEPEYMIPDYNIQTMHGSEIPALLSMTGRYDLYELNLTCGFQLKGNADHRVLYLAPSNNLTPVWKNHGSLYTDSSMYSYAGGYVAVRCGGDVWPKYDPVLPKSKVLDIAMARLLGCIAQRVFKDVEVDSKSLPAMVIECGNNSYVQRAVGYLLDRVFSPRRPYSNVYSAKNLNDPIDNNLYEVWCVDPAIIAYMRGLNITNIVRSMTKTTFMLWLSGYMLASGAAIHEDGCLSLSFSDKLLAETVRLMFLNMGCVCVLKQDRYHENSEDLWFVMAYTPQEWVPYLVDGYGKSILEMNDANWYAAIKYASYGYHTEPDLLDHSLRALKATVAYTEKDMFDYVSDNIGTRIAEIFQNADTTLLSNDDDGVDTYVDSDLKAAAVSTRLVDHLHKLLVQAISVCFDRFEYCSTDALSLMHKHVCVSLESCLESGLLQSFTPEELSSIRVSTTDALKQRLVGVTDTLTMTETNRLRWLNLFSVTRTNHVADTLDFMTPFSHTVITNGIVSHNSDVRLQLTSRALSGVPGIPVGKGMLEREKSVTRRGAYDTYRYIHVKAVKNKLSPPNMETWLRLWVSDGKRARGFDVVWDTYQYLLLTGQCTGFNKQRTNKATINLIKHGGTASDGYVISFSVTWLEFKLLIVGTIENIKGLFAKLGVKPFYLRKYVVKQAAGGKGVSLYYDEALRSGNNDNNQEASVVDDDAIDDSSRSNADSSDEDYDDGLPVQGRKQSVHRF